MNVVKFAVIQVEEDNLVWNLTIYFESVNCGIKWNIQFDWSLIEGWFLDFLFLFVYFIQFSIDNVTIEFLLPHDCEWKSWVHFGRSNWSSFCWRLSSCSSWSCSWDSWIGRFVLGLWTKKWILVICEVEKWKKLKQSLIQSLWDQNNNPLELN